MLGQRAHAAKRHGISRANAGSKPHGPLFQNGVQRFKSFILVWLTDFQYGDPTFRNAGGHERRGMGIRTSTQGCAIREIKSNKRLVTQFNQPPDDRAGRILVVHQYAVGNEFTDTRARTSSAIPGRPFSTRNTVAMDTFACRATAP